MEQETITTEKINEENEKEVKNENQIHYIEQQDLYRSSTVKSGDEEDEVTFRKNNYLKRSNINRRDYAQLHKLSTTQGQHSVANIKNRFELRTSTLQVLEIDSDTENEDVTKELAKNSAENNGVKLDSAILRKDNIDKSKESSDDKVTQLSPKVLDKEKIEKITRQYFPEYYNRRDVKSEIYPKNNDNNSSKKRLSVNEKPKSKDENSNDLVHSSGEDDDDFITTVLVRREASQETINDIRVTLDSFIMDKKPKEKRRSNSFRKLLSGSFFGKDKKKIEENIPKKDYDNIQNEQNRDNSFSRNTPYRHTTGGYPKKDDNRLQRINNTDQREVEEKFANMHIHKFNQIKHNFSNIENNGGVINNILDDPVESNKNSYITSYPNKYIDTSSSASTLESEKLRSQNEINTDKIISSMDNYKSNRFSDDVRHQRGTPPRAQETHQDIKLVHPKASLPINSERPLPNPYRNDNTENDFTSSKMIEQGYNSREPQPLIEKSNSNQPYFEETYGTVFDSVDYARSRGFHKPQQSKDDKPPQSPKSPSLENTKLRLPPNREIIPLEPRVKSPIPQNRVSTEKLIATELLKGSRSPTPPKKINSRTSPSHQNFEIEIDYPENVNKSHHFDFPETTVISKPPRLPPKENNTRKVMDPNELQKLQREMDRYPEVSPDVQEKITTNVMVHSPTQRSPTPNNLIHGSLSPSRPLSARSSTPLDTRSNSSIKSSPQKDDMRRNVEAYYWKEIKKLKEKENQDIYMYQMQNMPIYGYTEDPIMARRSRSSSPSPNKNCKRSLSLPRDPRVIQPNYNNYPPENLYGRVQRDSIPENRAIVNGTEVLYGPSPNQKFVRNVPGRNTVMGGNPRIMYDNYSDGTYRPIFKRGSLSRPTEIIEDPYQLKKVSFSNSRNSSTPQIWPTKNGFTKSPPQRRLDNKRTSALEDDVFLPNTPTLNKPVYNGPPIENIYYERDPRFNQEPLYASKSQLVNPYYARQAPEPLYGQRMDIVKTPHGLTRHGSLQIHNPAYLPVKVPPRKIASVDPNEINYYSRQEIQQVKTRDPTFVQKREIIINDEIYGEAGPYRSSQTVYTNYPLPYENIYVQQQKSIQNPIYAPKPMEPIYGQRRVMVNNKVCDMYGQIHDSGSPNSAQVQKSGVLMGQLQRPPSNTMLRQSHNQLSGEQFQRNSRLTASASDMNRRYQNAYPKYVMEDFPRTTSLVNDVNGPVGYNSDRRYRSMDYGVQYVKNEEAPTRPLPAVPGKKKSDGDIRIQENKNEKEASPTQNVDTKKVKPKKKGFFRFK